MILVDVKSRTIFLVPSFRRFIFFHAKKTGWVLMFLVVVVFLVGSLEKHGDSPRDFRTPMLNTGDLGHRVLGTTCGVGALWLIRGF